MDSYICSQWDSKWIPETIDEKNPIKYIRNYLNTEYLCYKKIYCYDIHNCIKELGIFAERPYRIKNIPSVSKNNFDIIVNWFVSEYNLLKRIKVTDFMIDCE
jgi:hypothetical protein